MVAHHKSARRRVDMIFPQRGIHEPRILIPKIVAGTIEFAFVVEEDDRSPERTKQISSRWDEQ